VAILLIVLQTRFRDNFISPGPLTQQHAEFTNAERPNGTAEQCSVCHAAANDGMTGWVATLAIGHGNTPSQSQLCMKCHGKDIPAALAQTPHNLPPEILASITAARGGNNLHGLFSRVTKAAFASNPTEPACAACHHEHHGADHDLTAIDSASCQACHRERYQSFAEDHPDFGTWPYARRTRIIFDHAAHQAKHFVDKKQPFDCQTCHVADATHAVELLTSYDRACASCHDDKMRTSVGQGVPIIAMPTLDVAAFRKAGIDVGTWPAAATGDFDGRMPPQMKLLLAGDPDAAKAIAQLGPSFEFSDIEADNAEQLRSAAALVQAIKRLLIELSQDAPNSIRTRMATALGRNIADVEVRPLLAGLSADTIRAATKQWLPNADVGSNPWDSSAFNRESSDVKDQKVEARTPIVKSYAQAGNWIRDDATSTIRYQPAAHADPVLATWLNLVIGTPKLDDRPLLSAVAKEFTKPTAPGQCAICHSVEQLSSDVLTISWRPYDRTIEGRTFTKFSHGPHLRLPQLADCTACHALDPQANTTASYTDHDPRRFASEFKPLSKQQCAQCHVSTAAGDSCQSCHRYHVDEVDEWRTPRGLANLDTAVNPDTGDSNQIRTSNDTRPAPH
jgi:hypothetical protein